MNWADNLCGESNACGKAEGRPLPSLLCGTRTLVKGVQRKWQPRELRRGEKQRFTEAPKRENETNCHPHSPDPPAV